MSAFETSEPKQFSGFAVDALQIVVNRFMDVVASVHLIKFT